MAKIKPNQSHQKAQKQAKKMAANGQTKSKENPKDVYEAALTLAEQSQPEQALQQAKKLWLMVQNGSVNEALPALNLLGDISIELGDVDAATGYFEQAVALDPDGKVPEAAGGGAEKFLWLAQLCEAGGRASVDWFERGVSALRNEIAGLEGASVPGIDQDALMMMRVEKKRKLANALCGIVEVYMTDLSWEDDAEARCESLITEAMTVEDETSPEVLQTLASVRLSQERKEDAQSALRRSLETWQNLEPEDPAVPDFATRVSLSRLLMEAEMEQEALEVLDRLVREDDQSIEAWYLGGWCQYLIAGRLKAKEDGASINGAVSGNSAEAESHDSVESMLKGSRTWLSLSLKLYERVEYEDERLRDHARELVTGLDQVLGPEEDEADGEDGAWEEWAGLASEDDEDEQMEDL